MSGWRAVNLEITLSRVSGPCPENHTLEPYAWPVSEQARWLGRTLLLTGRSAQLIRWASLAASDFRTVPVAPGWFLRLWAVAVCGRGLDESARSEEHTSETPVT